MSLDNVAFRQNNTMFFTLFEFQMKMKQVTITEMQNYVKYVTHR
jgi:hypothetical protein